MHNGLEQFDSLLSELKPLAQRYLGNEKLECLWAELQDRLRENMLQVMLFGSYNAGKSSLINVLMAEDIAPVADVPKTATADRYEWNGCYLLDTPGVNAPIEHEELTAEQIKRSELMLFVIREGDQDVKDVYDRLFEMIEKNKKIFIVFNHQLSGDALNTALNRLTDILNDYLVDRDVVLDVVSKIPVLPVNVKTAHSAVLKRKQFDNESAVLLAEHSGLVDFESAFKLWLSEFDNENGYLNQLKKFSAQCMLEPLTQALSELQHDPDSLLSDKQYQRNALNKEQSLAVSTVSNYIRQEVNLLKPEISALFESDSSEAELTSGMQELAVGLSANVSDFLSQRVEGVELESAVVSDVSGLHSSDSTAANGGFSETIEDTVVGLAKNADHKGLAKSVLLKLRKLKVPGFKGRWEKTLGKWAGRAGPVIQVAVGLWEVKAANDKQNAHNDEQRRQQLACHQLIEGGVSMLASSVIDVSTTAIEEAFGPTLDSLDSEIRALMDGSNEAAKDYDHLLSVTARIGALAV